MAEKIIVVKEKRRGCGCGTFIGLAVLAFFAFVWYEGNRPSSAPSAPEDPNVRSFDLPEFVELRFEKILKSQLNDPSSYEALSTRYAPTKKGRVYYHEFTAKNGFGGRMRSCCALLFSTNKAEAAWTYVAPDQMNELAEMLKE